MLLVSVHSFGFLLMPPWLAGGYLYTVPHILFPLHGHLFFFFLYVSKFLVLIKIPGKLN